MFVTGGMAIREMVAETKVALSVLFSPENKELWYVCFPTSDSISATATPPSLSTYNVGQFSALTETEQSLMMTGKEQLEKAIDKLFVFCSRLLLVGLHCNLSWPRVS